MTRMMFFKRNVMGVMGARRVDEGLLGPQRNGALDRYNCHHSYVVYIVCIILWYILFVCQYVSEGLVGRVQKYILPQVF
jgi:hypothetical protein